MLRIGFQAVGIESDGQKYACNFHVELDERATPQQINHAIQFAQRQFKEYHPTGKVLQQASYRDNVPFGEK